MDKKNVYSNELHAITGIQHRQFIYNFLGPGWSNVCGR